MPDYDAYCDFSSGAAAAVAGGNIILQVWSIPQKGDPTLLAVAGQQGLTINRSADSIEVTSKDTQGGWKSTIAGMKEWSIDVDGAYVPSDASHKLLGEAYANGDLVCLKVYDRKNQQDMFGGVAAISDYTLEAPYDDAMTYSLSLDGNGPLTDLSEEASA